jgi:hypothetical protein
MPSIVPNPLIVRKSPVIPATIVGPIGKQGRTGPPGIVVPGSTTGDIIRWNETTKAWEVKSEPLIFNGIILNPSTVALSDVEGGLFYKSTDKSVNVCTSAI